MSTDKVSPAILNAVRGRNNVGPNSIKHVHHLRPQVIPAQPEGAHDNLSTTSEQTRPHEALSLLSTTNRISSLFKAALTAIKGQGEQRNDPPPS